MYKIAMRYFSKHPLYAAVVFFIIGTGFGIIISRPLGIHPVRYGLALLTIGLAGKLYPLINKVK